MLAMIFSSGSSLFLSALRSLASAPPHSSGAPVLPPVSAPLPFIAPLTPALALSAFPPLFLSSASSLPPVSTPLPSAPPLGFSTPSVRPPPGFSASATSHLPSFAPPVPPSAPSSAPSTPSAFSFHPPAPTLASFPGVAAPAVPDAPTTVPATAQAVPVGAHSLFRPFADSGSSEPPVTSAPAFVSQGVSSAAVPGVPSGVPLAPPQYPFHSAPSASSTFAFAPS